MRRIGRRQANLSQRGEDLVGRPSGHLDRGRGNIHVLIVEALLGSSGFKNGFPILQSDFGGAVRLVVSTLVAPRLPAASRRPE